MEILTLIVNHNECSIEELNKFIEAHGEHMRWVCTPPSTANPVLQWPWQMRYEQDTSKLSNEAEQFFIQQYWKVISVVPRKAHHGRYTMSVSG